MCSSPLARRPSNGSAPRARPKGVALQGHQRCPRPRRGLETERQVQCDAGLHFRRVRIDRAPQAVAVAADDRPLQKGMEKGREEGTRQTLLRILGKRFGEVSPAVRERIEAIGSIEELGRLVDRILEVRSIEELGLGR